MKSYHRGIFITGIGTGVGKTTVSAIIAESWRASYWKPVQCGNLDKTDTAIVTSLTTRVALHPEAYRFALAASPHAAAAREQITINMLTLQLPRSADQRPIVVEGAGGVLVPLNDKRLMLDLMEQLHLPVLLVTQNYLGSINHTLLSIAAIRTRNLLIKGLVVIGKSEAESESAIVKFGGVDILRHIPKVSRLDREFIGCQASLEWIHELL